MSYQVAIPSYRRAETLASKTWPLLTSRGVKPEDVTVFVADEEDASAYKEAVPEANVVSLGYEPQPWSGELPEEPSGLGRVRSLIPQQYPAGTCLVDVDDDVADIFQRVDEKTTRPVDDLGKFLEISFANAEESGVHLWGVYPSANPYFMRPKLRVGLAFICGGLSGMRVRHDECERLRLDVKTDYERTLRFVERDGAVMRWDGIGLKTTVYRGQGGMEGQRVDERVAASVAWLMERWPSIVEVNEARRSGKLEIKLRKPRRT